MRPIPSPYSATQLPRLDDAVPRGQAAKKHLHAVRYKMRIRITVWLLLLVFVATSPAALAKGKAHPLKTKDQAAQSPATDAQKKNIQEHIELMRTNVRDKKGEIMGAVMQFDIDDSAKFWPIYSEYDAELTKLNNLRVKNI